MANPIFNTAPRCILIQPTKDSDIIYYIAVMDMPSSVCRENPFGDSLYDHINPSDASSKDITIHLPKGIQIPADFKPNSPEDFRTFLMPICRFSKTAGNFVPKENIIIQDESGNKISGQIDSSKTITLFKEPYALPNNDPKRLMAFRPFVIKNTNFQENAFIIGGLLSYNSGENANWGNTIDLKKSIISPPRFILCPNESSNQTNKKHPIEHIFVCFESERDGYESIELEGDTDPDDAGLFQYDAGVNLYDFPTGSI
ncbi:MAG: hypothetical protein IPK03_17135 [Bacteroidetes bacterium]|nr:hypothetical protein [Bacteroidota bacterium]